MLQNNLSSLHYTKQNIYQLFIYGHFALQIFGDKGSQLKELGNGQRPASLI